MPKKKKSQNTKLEENSVIENNENSIEDEKNTLQEEKSLEYFGKRIRETRISNNLSLESVSGHLHISVKILEAIEEGKPENGPTPVFFRGLVRTYCQFLELDKTEIIDKIDELLRKENLDEDVNIKTLKPVFSVSDSNRIRNILTVFTILFGASLIYYIYSDQINFENITDNVTKGKNQLVEIESEIETKKNTTKKIKQSILTNETSIETNKILAEVKKKKVRKNNLQTEILQKSDEPLTLEIEASEGTWISIAVDNNEIQDVLISTDEIEQWEAKNNFSLTIGNTAAVRVLLNGREIETDRTNDLISNWIVDTSFLP